MKRFVCIALVALGALATGSAVSPTESAFVERVRQQVPAAGGAGALRRYIETIGSNAPDLSLLEGEALQEVRARSFSFADVAALGPIQAVEFRGVEAGSGFDVYRVTTQHGRSQWLVMLAPSGRISRIYWRALPLPPPSPPTRGEFVEQLRGHVDEMAAQDEFAGVVLVAERGTPLFAAAYGMADRERNVPNNLETKFRIGSMNKMFTAVAIMQLVEQGRVRLDATVGDYLPDYPNRDIAEQVTILQLLTHTGGTGDMFGPQFTAHRAELVELSDYVDLYGRRGPDHGDLGDRFAYSNYGFILLGRIIETVTGRSYDDFVRASVFAPAGMISTGALPETTDVPGRSFGYRRREGSTRWTSNTSTLPPRGTSAGGGYSTAGDLLRFAEALQAHRLLSSRSTALLTTGRVVLGETRYALGFFEWRPDGTRWIGHSGGAPGMCGELRIAPDRDFVIVVLSNIDPPACTGVADFAEVRLPA